MMSVWLQIALLATTISFTKAQGKKKSSRQWEMYMANIIVGCTEGSVRLAGAPTCFAGEVEYCYATSTNSREWVIACGSSWNHHLSELVCRLLTGNMNDGIVWQEY